MGSKLAVTTKEEGWGITIGCALQIVALCGSCHFNTEENTWDMFLEKNIQQKEENVSWQCCVR